MTEQTPHDDVITQALANVAAIEGLAEGLGQRLRGAETGLRLALEMLAERDVTIASLQNQLARCREGKP